MSRSVYPVAIGLIAVAIVAVSFTVGVRIISDCGWSYLWMGKNAFMLWTLGFCE